MSTASHDPSQRTTTLTLIERIRRAPDDRQLWTEFIDRYSPAVFGWAKREGLSDEDANDITQEVFRKLLENGFATFDRIGRSSARPYVHETTRRAVLDWFEKSSREKEREIEYVRRRLPELDQSLGEEFDLEELEIVLSRIRGSSRDVSWSCFELRWLEGLSADETAKRLNLSPDAVYKNAQRILLRVSTLLNGAGPPPIPR